VPYQAFQCKDGMYMVGAGNDKQVEVRAFSCLYVSLKPRYCVCVVLVCFQIKIQFERLAAAVDMPELSRDARFKTNRDRTRNRATLIPILEAKFR
jgi:crotonobetainyl-CoA:carnitine CoA-transferase CaiB-like acyl-CoA transferase